MDDDDRFFLGKFSLSLIIQKYGGTSVGTLDRIQVIARHIASHVEQEHRLVVVVSAMGQHTDELLEMALRISPTPPRRELDMLLTAGERVSMSLLSIALHELKIPSVSLTGSQSGILTDENHGNARIQKVLGDRIRDGLARDRVVIVAGFQGMSPKTKEITTLGRGGSDVSAIAIAAALKADACEIYKDVDGICTADPRRVPKARLLGNISWNEMAELAWGGAQVLHPRGVHIAARFGMTLEIRSSFHLDRRGTVISGGALMESMQVTALTHKEGAAVLHVKLAGSGRALVDRGIAWLWQQGEAPLAAQTVVANGELHGVFVFSAGLVDGFIKELNNPRFECEKGLSAITVVGQGFSQNPEMVAEISQCACGEDLRFFDLKNGVLTMCVPDSHVDKILRDIHTRFIER